MNEGKESAAVYQRPNLDEDRPIRRPCSVTLLALGVFILAILNLTRFFLSLQQWEFLNLLPGVPPLYLALTGLFWGALGLVLAFFLWRGRPTAPRLTLIFALLYILYYWTDRLLVVKNPLSADFALGFQLAMTVIILLFLVWVLSRTNAKSFFRRNE